MNVGVGLLKLCLRDAQRIDVEELLVVASWRLALILLRRLHLDEVGHEQLVRDELEPCECEGRVVVRVQVLQEIR